jgi:hypothetical protein
MGKVKIVPVFTGTLEATEAATQAAASRVVVMAYESSKLTIAAQYTTGAAETSNTCTIKVYGYMGVLSADETSDTANWVQIGVVSYAGGVGTVTASQFDIVGASAATTYSALFLVDINYPKLMFTAVESGVATNKGTLVLKALLQ